MTPAELIGRARERNDMGAAANAAGLYDEAKRHWTVADGYLSQFEALIVAEAQTAAEQRA